jgi:hypothetical protein
MKRLLALVPILASALMAQDGSGWRRFSEGAAAPAAGPNSQAAPQQAPQQAPAAAPVPPPPATLTLPAGTWLTVRITNPLSSDHNQPGDAFSAVLVQPVIAQGLVVAHRGQTVAGRVAVAEKAGRVSGMSKLGIELTELGLVDGQQVTVRTQAVQRNGGTSWGRDAAGIGTTVGAGAAIGAAVNGGVGAGVGAAAGVVASTIGVLTTRGRATVVTPETVMTFRLEAPVTISTERSYEAFRPVDPRDYEQNQRHLVSQQPPPPRPYYGGPGYYPPYYAPYYGPSFFFYSGPRYYRRW